MYKNCYMHVYIIIIIDEDEKQGYGVFVSALLASVM